MSHQFRFYVPPGEVQVGEVALGGQEAHHAVNVARVRNGEEVALFDGRGNVAEASVTGVERNRVLVQVMNVAFHPRIEPALILLVGATTKSKAVEETIRASVPFEPGKIGFFVGHRSNHKRIRTDKWHRWSIESAKQCGSAWVPDFRVYDSPEVAIRSVSGALLVGLPEATSPISSETASNSIVVLIGPEGGFSSEERALFEKSGARSFSLGPNVLRTELAAPIALAQVRSQSMRMNRE